MSRPNPNLTPHTKRATRTPKRPTTSPKAPARRAELSKIWAWLGVLIPVVLIVGVIAAGSDDSDLSAAGLVGSDAPEFTLPATGGTPVSLGDVVADGNALLYFSMGVGCDGCFAQIPEINGVLDELGITLVPIMVQPPDQVDATAARFDIRSPILIDQDRAVSSAYGMLGVYGHTDRPSHSFALVTRDRKVDWVKHYATMFVPADDLLTDLQAAG